MYLINHVSAEALTTGWMIPSGTNSLPAEVVILFIQYSGLFKVRPKFRQIPLHYSLWIVA
jgi:hypothetical protein